MKVLIIEDDKILNESLQVYLRSQGMTVDAVVDETEFEWFLASNTYDAVVLDLMMPRIRGEDIIARMRRKGVNTPVLVLTAKNTITDKERCFELGADDYITKPFEIRELLIRLKSLSKKVHLQQVIKIGDVTVDLNAESLYRDDREIRISKTAWTLLALLIRHRGQIVSNETIMGYVWGNKGTGDEVLRTYIKILRKVLPEDALVTFKGRGYKLT
ncbi:response regulator transcription factor [Candidatus Magnetobacterium casense]|uniref:Response regulator transcription factor n=1 Tax=Candidatus Magnetobacterium casense TaxID=1455061 RepID=A0ABS6RZD9_9BACT|nr:response regulator transcription factor [Candidatus Magnetobacterium casensis]MBV6342017.1 response regulator transcription factor [Candidatus Magnetobacterium casensis]